jgi:hypothetical protein
VAARTALPLLLVAEPVFRAATAAASDPARRVATPLRARAPPSPAF